MTGRRLPRRLHAGAWWTWALGLGAAATMTTNPLLLTLIVAVAALVVTSRGSGAAWARGFRAYLLLGLVVIGIRLVFRIFLGGQLGERLLFTLPVLPLPDWATGISVGGPVMVESVLAATYDGLRLATIVICVGAANSLADPRRLLASLPRALYDIGASVVVALSLAPHLIESVGRVRRARRLRGDSATGLRTVRSLLAPVLEDAMDRSLALAASMDARGYGRTGTVAPSRRRITGFVILSGLGAVCVGMFWLLDGERSPLVAASLLGAGLGLATLGFGGGRRAVQRTRYRPDRWRGAEWTVAGAGAVAAIGVAAVGLMSPADLSPSVQPLVWPPFSPSAMAAVLMATTPAWAAPPSAHSAPAASPEPQGVAS